jgi:transaldolase / glucose-6-phosphate isomerase
MSAIDMLHQFGQSLWYDNIQRKLIEDGTLHKMISKGEIRGITSNPAIFNQAISNTTDYDSALTPMAWAGWDAEKIYTQLAVEDIQAAADLFRPLYESSGGRDGYVSLEVSPYLANDTEATLREAINLWNIVQRPNLMVKIPATKAGLPAIRAAVSTGLNINITLIFSLARYAEVMDAYLAGLEDRVDKGLSIKDIASVASFFVSRVDTFVDTLLQERMASSPNAKKLLGKAAVANARVAYSQFQEIFSGDRFTRLERFGARKQRPLWASTSTKNPNYHDVVYIEELIGEDTVNTVPPQTLDAYRDHGKARLSLGEKVDEARQTLADLESFGIEMADVTATLEQDGVKAFSDAFKVLLQSVDTRRKAAQDELGSLKSVVENRIKEMEEKRFSTHLHAHDAELWTADPKGQEEIRKRMGWLEAPTTSRSLLPQLASAVQKAQQDGFSKVLLLGMGGSSLAPEVMRLVCGVGEVNGRPGLDLTILDSTDPCQVQQATDWAAMDRTLFIVASKSGTTSEVNAFKDYFWALAQQNYGDKAGEHFIAITDPETPVAKNAYDAGYRHVFLADPSVGGRNSALTAFGMVPAAMLGLDVERLLGRGQWMTQQCGADVPAGRNPGLVLGAILGEAAMQGKDKMTILADPLWAPLGAWLEQLIAESSGKDGKGILPIDEEPQMAVERYGPDRIFVYLKSNGAKQWEANELVSHGFPVITLSSNDSYDLTAEFYRWEFATAVACAVLGVNSFDQPDVQVSKTLTKKKLDAYQVDKKLQEGEPLWEGAGGSIFGSFSEDLSKANTLGDVIHEFLHQASAGDYVAINAYLPRNPEMKAELQRFRRIVQELTMLPSTIGFGPRFLHSTGQLHKGGPASGIFLQITSDACADVDIPGQGLSFGILERAQALGDLEALIDRKRRVIRVHMKGSGLAELL